MKKNRGTVLASLGQIKDIFSVLIQAIPSTLTSEAAQKIIGQKGRLIKELRRVFQEITGATGFEELLAEWRRFYWEVLGTTVDFSDLVFPEKQEGFDWLIVMSKVWTANELFAKCKERFGAYRHIEDLDTIKSVRKTDRTYAIWLRDREEADEENKNKSAKDCEKEGINGITLPERLLLELWYHWKTGKHLDVNNWTLCSGSRSSDGRVPHVLCHDDRLRIFYYSSDFAHGRLRARAAVS